MAITSNFLFMNRLLARRRKSLYVTVNLQFEYIYFTSPSSGPICRYRPLSVPPPSPEGIARFRHLHLLKLIFTTKLNIWTMGFIISPFLSPFAFGFLVARTSWRWAYGIGSMYSLIVVLLIVFFMEETYVSTISLEIN